jgi:hypothetical protein
MTATRTPDWAAIGRQFRAGRVTIAVIAARFGVSPSAIRRMAKERGWVRKTHPVTAQSNAEIRQRLRDLIERKLEQLEERLMSDESDSPADSERQARELGTLIRNHARLEQMEEAAARQAAIGGGKSGENGNRGEEGDDAERWRKELAERIARLRQQWSA